MWQRAMTVSGGGGGGVTVDDLKFDGKTEISGSAITSRGGSWTATQDCIMGGTVESETSAGAEVYLNGNVIIMAYKAGNACKAFIGIPASSQSTPTKMGIFIPKGATISTRSDAGQYNLKFYA